jgi:hypothetical protein
MILAAGIAVPARSTCVFAVMPKPNPVKVTVVPPVELPDAGLIPVTVGGATVTAFVAAALFSVPSLTTKEMVRVAVFGVPAVSA